MIRAARADELAWLREIERESGVLFADVGMHDVAAAEPMALDALAAFLDAGCLWVATDDDAGDDLAVGWAAAAVVDGDGHLDQLSVLPSHGRRGLGSALVSHVCDWAAAAGCAFVTLSTFRDLGWNAPFYERLGFRILDESELTPALLAVRAREAELGLDVGARVIMRRGL